MIAHIKVGETTGELEDEVIGEREKRSCFIPTNFQTKGVERGMTASKINSF